MIMGQIGHNSDGISDLPESMQDIADELGFDFAEKMVAHFGGTMLYVPAKMTPTSRINALGLCDAQKLVEAFPSNTFDVPMSLETIISQKRKVMGLLSEGNSNHQIARALHISHRTVSRIIAGRSRKVRVKHVDTRQISIFDIIKYP
jgi:hypothetical protein